MASGFNLTAQINLRGPSNIPQIAADIRRQLGSINANVNFRLDPNAARNVTQLNANLQNFNRTLAQTATSSNNAAAAIRNLSNAINRVNAGNLAQSLTAASSATARVSQSMSSVSKSVSMASSEMVEFGKQSGLAIRRFAAFSTVTGVVYGVVNAINQGVKAYIEYDRELVKLQQVTGQSAKGLESLEKMITSLATNLGVGSNELTQISSTLAQAGLSARDTERALKALALSSLAPSFDSMNETVEGSIALMRQFGIGASDLEKALGSVNSVAAKFAVEAADLITAIQRTGGVFATASKGVSEGTDALNEFLAVFTSVRATTRESAETIATGLRTIFTRIQREDTISALKEYGVNLTDLDGKFVGAYKAVEALSQGLSRLDPRDLKFSRIVEELGGFRQIGKVIPLIQQFATAQEALKVAQSGQGSLTADAAKAQESLAIQTSKVREEFLALFREIGKSDSFQTIIKGALSVTSAFIKAADSIKGVLPILGVALAFKGASAITQFGSGFVQGVRGSGGARGLGQRFAGGRSEGGEIKFATGGLVPGVGDSDSVSAKLTPGEFVMRKSAVRSIGVGNLSRMNRGGRTSKFNKGGPVPVSSLLTRSGGSSIRNAIGNTNLELDDTVSINIIPKEVPLNNTDFLNIWLRAKNSAKKGSGQFKNYAGVNVGKENRDRLRDLAGKSRKEQQAIKSGYGSDVSQQVSMLQSAEGRWGVAYEEFLINKLRGNWTKASSKTNYPIDIVQKLANNSIKRIGEVKFRTKSVEDIDLISKLLRYRIEKGSINRYFKENQKIPKDLDKNIGSLDYFWAGNYKKEFYKFIEERQRIQAPGFVKAATGGVIQKFPEGGAVTAAEAETASRATILNVLKRRPGGIDATAKKVGVSASEIYGILGVRNPDARTKSLQDAIRREYIITSNRRAGAAKGQITRLQNNNLEVAAAGLFGSVFAPTREKIESPLLSASPMIRILSGVMNPKLAERLEKDFAKSVNKTVAKTAKKAMISDILENLGLGKTLNLDFDRTLAFGADKILSDPKTPAFAEFGDRTKVIAALQKAKLSNLGRELSKLVASKPELLSFMRVITARPQSTVDLLQQWLAQKGLPIALSQFTGLGGPAISANNIANLKAQMLQSGSLFVDDDPRNIAAADTRGDIRTYQYGAKLATANSNTDSTIQGGLLEKTIQNLGGPGAVKGLGFDFPNGLQGAAKYFNLPPNIPTDVKRTVSGPSTIKDNIVTYLKNVMGYADGGTVPAMVSNGEAYVPPELAKRIGYGKLNRLNQADRNGISSFSSGGISIFKGPGNGTSDSIGPINLPVGSFILRQKAVDAIGLYAGGAVQNFASGSTVLPARPANPTVENVRIPDNILENLRLIAKALTDVGLSSSSAAMLLRKNANITYREAERVIEADIRRMRVAGMSTQTILAAENQLRETRQQAAGNIAARQRFDGVNGNQLQQIDTEAQRRKNIAMQRARAGGMTDEQINDEGFQNRLTNRSYRQATQAVTGVSAGRGVSGNSIQQYIQQTMMDRRTLAQMDRQYVAQRRQEIFNQLSAEQGVTATRAQIRQAASQARVLAEQEVKERRQILNQLAVNNGIAGPGRAGYTGFGTLDSAFGGALGRAAAIPGNIYGNVRDTIRSQGLLGAGITGIGSGIQGAARGLGRFGGSLGGQGGFFLSMGVGMLAGQGENIANMMGGDKRAKAGRGAGIEAGLGTMGAGLSLASGLAMVPGIGPVAAGFTLVATAAMAVKEGFDASAKAVKEYDKSLRESKISDLNDKIAKDLENFNKTGNTNNLMSSVSRLGSETQNNLLINTRDAAADKAKSQSFYSWMMGESKPILTSEDYKGLGKTAAKDNEIGAQVARAIVEKQIQSGRDLKDIAQDPGFAAISEAIARAEPEFMTFIARLKDATQQETDQKIAGELSRRRTLLMGDAAWIAAQKTRDAAKAMEEANRSSQQLTQTFESMQRSFNQAIGKFRFDTERSMSIGESRSNNLTGKSELSKIRLRDLNILENPLAYDDRTKQEASYRVAKDITGSDRPGLDPREKQRRINETNLIAGVLNTDPVQLSNRLVGSIRGLTKGNTNFNQVSDKVTRNLDSVMTDQNIPEVMRNVIKKQVSAIIDNIKDEGDKSTDNEKITKLETELQNTLGDGKAAGAIRELAIEAIKTKEDLDTLSSSINKANDLQINANRLRIEAQNIRTETGLSLRQTISGAPVGLAERTGLFNSQIAGLTGGVTDPTQIRQNIQNLNNRFIALETRAENTNSDQERINLQVEMGKLAVQINNNQTALETLANSTELASAAMDQLQNAQKMQASRLANIDQILSSTPEELQKFNESIIRVTKRSQGINPGPSREAFKAYNQTLRQTGGNVRAAQMAGYSQMAQDRAADLQNMERYRDTYILGMTNQRNPLTGNNYTTEEASNDFNRKAANTRGQMANEMGAVGMYGPGIITGIMAGVDPRVDALGADAAQRFVAANQLRAKSKEEQATLNAVKATEEFTAALQKAILGLQPLQDMFGKIQELNQKNLGINVGNGGVPQAGAGRAVPRGGGIGGMAFANGGIVYAAQGQLINFEPKGTDTVPAMLTPGEFVVNRASTQKHLPLLQAINEGIGGYSKGGVVYLAEGGRPGVSMMMPRPQPLGVVNPGYTSQFKQLDKNSNIYLELGEIDQNLISAMDINKDNRLSVAEFLGLTANSDRIPGGMDWRLPAATVLKKPIDAASTNYMIYQTLRTEKYKNKYRSTEDTQDGRVRDPAQPVTMADLDRARDDPQNRDRILTGQSVRPGEKDRSIPISVRPSLVPGDPRSRGLDTEYLETDNLGRPLGPYGEPIDPNKPFDGEFRLPDEATRNEFSQLPNVVPIPEAKQGEPTTTRPKFARLISSAPTMDDFYRLDIDQDGVLSGKELSAYRRLDTDLNRKIDPDEWMGTGFDPYSTENRNRYTTGTSKDRHRMRALSFYRNRTDEENKELSVLKAQSGFYDTNQSLIRDQRNTDRIVTGRLSQSSYPVRKAFREIETDRILFEEERRKIKEQNPDLSDAAVLERTVTALSEQGSAYQGNDTEWWKRERGITSQSGSYDETGTLEAIKNSNDLGTRDDPTGAKARAEIDSYLASQGARQQADRVAQGRGELPIDSGTAVIGTQGPSALVNEFGDAQEIGRARSTIRRREEQAARAKADAEARSREESLDARDKELGIDTSDINRDIYVSGTGGVSYQPGMGAKISIEDQKRRRREKVIRDRMTFTDKSGKYSQAGTIDSVDGVAGTVRIAKIDPKTGAPITRKDKNGNESQVYTTVPIDQLDAKGQARINDVLKKQRDQEAETVMRNIDRAVEDIEFAPDVVVPSGDFTDQAKITDLERSTRETFISDQASFDASILPAFKPDIVIDPITRKPKNLDGTEIDIKDLEKKLTTDRKDLAAQLEDWQRTGRLGEGETRTAALKETEARISSSLQQLANIQNARYEFDSARNERNLSTQKRYDELKKESETGRGLSSTKKAEEFARLSIERGVAPGEIPGGRTVVVERAMRSEAFAASENLDAFGQPVAVGNMEKQSIDQFKKDLFEVKRTSQSDKLISEISSNASQSVANLTGSSYLGSAAGLATGFGLGMISPENIVIQAGTAGFGLIPALGIDIASAGGASALAAAAGDESGIKEGITQAAMTMGMTGAFRVARPVLDRLPRLPSIGELYQRGISSLDQVDANRQISELKMMFPDAKADELAIDNPLFKAAVDRLPKMDGSQKSRDAFAQAMARERANSPGGRIAAEQARLEEISGREWLGQRGQDIKDFFDPRNSPLLQGADAEFKDAVTRKELRAQKAKDVIAENQKRMDAEISFIRDNVTAKVKEAEARGANTGEVRDIRLEAKKELEGKGLLDRAKERLEIAQKQRLERERTQSLQEMREAFETDAELPIGEPIDVPANLLDIDSISTPFFRPKSSTHLLGRSASKLKLGEEADYRYNTAAPMATGPSQVTGWKGALKARGSTQEEFLKNDAIIEKWLIDNAPSQFKPFSDTGGDFWRFYTSTGSKTEYDNLVKRMQKELQGVYDEKFIYSNDLDTSPEFVDVSIPGFSGRFDFYGSKSGPATQNVRKLLAKQRSLGDERAGRALSNQLFADDSYTLGNNISTSVFRDSPESMTDFMETADRLYPELKSKNSSGNIRRRGKSSRRSTKPVPEKMSSGGLVYASNGALIAAQQVGTDSVPAMLTPGEFVVNREASQRYMPVLHAINKGYHNQGGIVQYLAGGGIVSPQYYAGGGLSSMLGTAGKVAGATGAAASVLGADIDMGVITELSKSISSLKETFGSLENVKELGDSLKQATSSMGQHIALFGENISNIPQQVMHDITATVTQHVLGINGAEEKYAKQFDGKMSQVAYQHAANIVSNLNKSSEGALTNGNNTGSIIGSQGAIT